MNIPEAVFKIITAIILSTAAIAFLLSFTYVLGPPEFLRAEKIEAAGEFTRTYATGPYTQKQLDDFMIEKYGAEKTETLGLTVRTDPQTGKQELLLPFGFDDYYSYDLDRRCWIFYDFRLTLLKTC